MEKIRRGGMVLFVSIALALVCGSSSRNLRSRSKELLQSLANTRESASLLLEGHNFVEMVGLPIVQDTISVEFYMRPTSCKVQGVWSQSYSLLTSVIPRTLVSSLCDDLSLFVFFFMCARGSWTNVAPSSFFFFLSRCSLFFCDVADTNGAICRQQHP